MKNNFKDHISSLLLKALKSKTMDEEYAQIDEWAKESEDNLRELKQMKTIWISSEDMHEYRNFDVKSGWEELEPKISETKSFKLKWLYLAAAIGLLLVSSYGMFFSNSQSSNTNTYVANALNVDILLEDNSNVWLRENSKLAQISDFRETRTVELEGEAYFDIARDEQRRFIIKAGKETITVLGTKFIVSNKNDAFKVVVESGLVEVNTGKRKIELSRNDKLVKQNGDYIKMKAIGEPHFDWVGDELYFENASLTRVLVALSEKFDIRFSNPKGTNINDCKITSQYNNESLSEILNELETIVGFEVKKGKGKQYIIEAVNCK